MGKEQGESFFDRMVSIHFKLQTITRTQLAMVSIKENII